MLEEAQRQYLPFLRELGVKEICRVARARNLIMVKAQKPVVRANA